MLLYVNKETAPLRLIKHQMVKVYGGTFFFQVAIKQFKD